MSQGVQRGNTNTHGSWGLAGIGRSKCLGGEANTRGVTGMSGRGRGERVGAQGTHGGATNHARSMGLIEPGFCQLGFGAMDPI